MDIQAGAAPRPKPRGPGWFWAMPNISVALFVIAMGALLWVLERHEHDLQRSALERDVQWAEQTIRLHLQGNEEALLQLAREQSRGTLDVDGFQIQASQHLANNAELTTIVWADAGAGIRWAAPFETTVRLLGEPLPAGASRRAFDEARDSGQPRYSEPFGTEGGGTGIELHVPVFRGRDFAGTISGLYSAEGILQHLVPGWFADKYQLSIIDERGRIIASNAAGAAASGPAHELVLDPPGRGLLLRATSYQVRSGLAQNMLVALVLGLSLLIVASLWALRKHMGRRVQAEKERDRLFKLSLDILCIMDLKGAYRRVNPAFQTVLGHAPQALAGLSFLDLVHPDDRAATEAELRRLAAGEPGANFENRCRCADGGYKWLLWSMAPAVDEGLLFGVAHDVTRRKRHEEALRAEYAFRKAMEDSVLAGLRAIDMEGRITYVNPAFCDMVGLTEAELVGAAAPFPYWHPENMVAAREALEMTLRGEAPRSGYEMTLMHRDGRAFQVRVYASPLIDSEGRQTGWMSAMHDITERKRANEALKASHERFVAVLDGLDAAVSVVDLESGEMLYANVGFNQRFGLAETEGCCHLAPWRRAGGEEPSSAEVEVEDPVSGRWYQVRRRVIRWVDGRQVTMEVATDITDHRQAEELSRQQQEKLQLTSRLVTMGEMASTLAHELNQPLSAIANYCMGCVNRLLAGNPGREELLGAMQKASFQAERAGKIIRRVREFVKKSEPKRAACELGEIVDEALGFAEIEARRKGVRVSRDLAADLPRVEVDRIMIEQLLLNLVKNGIEAMGDAAPDARVLAVQAALNDAGQVEVTVADRGHGIAPEDAERLFTPFFTTKSEGMGMGLSICRSIVEFHQGRLWAEPNPLGGTIFHVTLPAAQAVAQAS